MPLSTILEIPEHELDEEEWEEEEFGAGGDEDEDVDLDDYDEDLEEDDGLAECEALRGGARARLTLEVCC